MCPPTAVGHGLYNPAVVAHGDLFFRMTQYNADAQNTHAHSPL
jgi:hypothetical protein